MKPQLYRHAHTQSRRPISWLADHRHGINSIIIKLDPSSPKQSPSRHNLQLHLSSSSIIVMASLQYQSSSNLIHHHQTIITSSQSSASSNLPPNNHHLVTIFSFTCHLHPSSSWHQFNIQSSSNLIRHHQTTTTSSPSNNHHLVTIFNFSVIFIQHRHGINSIFNHHQTWSVIIKQSPSRHNLQLHLSFSPITVMASIQYSITIKLDPSSPNKSSSRYNLQLHLSSSSITVMASIQYSIIIKLDPSSSNNHHLVTIFSFICHLHPLPSRHQFNIPSNLIRHHHSSSYNNNNNNWTIFATTTNTTATIIIIIVKTTTTTIIATTIITFMGKHLLFRLHHAPLL